MKTIVVSYSLTGNNHALAESVAKGLQAGHITVSEEKKRTMGTIVADFLLCRTPKTKPGADVLAGYDAVLLAGPIWMGGVATPLRAYMKRVQKMGCPYAFLSISGGADSTNPKIPAELTRRVKRAPAAVIDFHIADMLPNDPKPTREITSAYRLTPEDVKTLTGQALKTLKDFADKEQAQ